MQHLNLDPAFTKYCVKKKLFSDFPLAVFDIGAREGFEEMWNIFEDQVIKYGVEPDEEECERINQSESGTVFPVFLSKSKGKQHFYKTFNPESSGLYEPNTAFVSKLSEDIDLAVESVIECETQTLDHFCHENKIPYLDYIKVDTEGSELDILQGGLTVIDKVLCINSEVYFQEFNIGRPLFRDVDQFLSGHNFYLYQLDPIIRHRRKVLPFSFDPNARASTPKGQISWSNAIYVKKVSSSFFNDRTEENGIRLLKTCVFLEMFGCSDCAIELLLEAQKHTFLPSKLDETNKFLDLLTQSDTENKVDTYENYFIGLFEKELAKQLLFLKERHPKLENAVDKIDLMIKYGKFTEAKSLFVEQFGQTTDHEMLLALMNSDLDRYQKEVINFKQREPFNLFGRISIDQEMKLNKNVKCL